MNAREKLLQEIETFLETQDIAAATLGKEAMGDSAFVLRLRAGRNIGIDTADKIRRYMRENQKPKRKNRRGGKRLAEMALAS